MGLYCLGCWILCFIYWCDLGGCDRAGDRAVEIFMQLLWLLLGFSSLPFLTGAPSGICMVCPLGQTLISIGLSSSSLLILLTSFEAFSTTFLHL